MRKLLHKREIVILAALVLAAVLLLLVPHGNGSAARLRFTDERSIIIPLDRDATLQYSGALGLTVTVQVQAGRIRFINSECPDHICEGYGWLDAPGETAICMPAGAYLEITN